MKLPNIDVGNFDNDGYGYLYGTLSGNGYGYGHQVGNGYNYDFGNGHGYGFAFLGDYNQGNGYNIYPNNINFGDKNVPS